MNKTTIAAIGAALAGALLVGASAPAFADGTLIEVEPATVSVPMPAPGHQVHWTMTIRNLTDQPLSLLFHLDDDVHNTDVLDALFFTVTGDEGLRVIDHKHIADINGIVVALPSLDAHDTYALHGWADLDRTAGNEYQNVDRAAMAFVTATADDGTSNGSPDNASPAAIAGATATLARTGAAVTAITAIAAAAIAAGWFLVRRRRDKEQSS